MAKITAIHSGGDWADASAMCLVLPDGMDIESEHKQRQAWYLDVYLPELRAGLRPTYMSLYEWLKSKGARDPEDDEIEVFEEH